MRVLITNHGLVGRGGTEVYSRDLVQALRARGHDVVLFSPLCGPFAEALRADGITVIDRLDGELASPDVIHGQHHLPAMAALARFQRTPAVFVCHGAVPWEETPPAHPRILHYVAVDDPCRERLEAARIDRPIDVIPNFVDLTRFRVRSPLPARPRRALVLSNSADRSWTDAIAAACAARGITMDVVGAGVQRASERPEDVLPVYDLVFAKARSALEAIATGCAVVTCDQGGLGTMATAEAWPFLRRMNLGFRTLTRRHEPAAVGAEIDRYDPEDARQLSDLVRRDAALDGIVERWITLYGDVIAAHHAGPRSSTEDEGLALSRYLAWLGGSRPPGVRALQELGRLEVQLGLARRQSQASAQARDTAEQRLATVCATRTWRAHNTLLALPGLASLYALIRGRRSP